MDKIQELEIRERELRDTLAPLVEAEEPDADAIAKATKELRAVNAQIMALKTLAPEPETVRLETGDVKDREMRALEKRANVGDVFERLLSGGQIDGAMAELQQERGLRSNEISIRQLMDLETRAVTPAPAEVGQNTRPILPYVFPQSASAFLGIDMPVVPVGDAVFPVLTAELSVEALAENGGGTETTGAFSGDVLAPARLQASFFYSREDRARFAGMDAALRQNLSDGLADGLDKQNIVGAGGLIGTSGLTLRTGDASATATYATYRGLIYDATTLDGRFAAMVSDLRVLMASDTYAHAAGVYRGNQDNTDGLAVMMRSTSGVRISAHIPAVGGDNDGDVVIRKGLAPDMVSPVWENIAIIEDEVTKAANGQIVLTAVMLQNRKILRADGFQRRAVQIA